MTQDEVIKLAAEAGFGNYAYEATGIFERFAAMIAAAEREKCTGTQEFVTLPREVVELAIEAIGDAKHKIEFDAIDALIAALKQPPTTEQSSAVQQPQANQPAMTPIAQRKLDSLLEEGYTISGYSIYHEQKHQHGFVTGAGLVGWWRPDGVEYPQPRGEQEPAAEHKLKDVRCECCGYMTHHREHMGCIRAAHAKREPLTDEEINKINRSTTWPVKSLAGLGDRQWAELLRCAARAIEAAHNIK